jgi:phosphoglucosamine mutase
VTLKFGTDGVRGVANSELSPELALVLGRAAARVLGGSRWLVGRDTRRSGPFLQAALTAGLASEGVEVIDLGVVPTPAVAFLSSADGGPGAVISASHNPFADNGIKFFAEGGRKLSDETEAALEAEVDRLRAEPWSDSDLVERPVGAAVGTLRSEPAEWTRWADHLSTEVLNGRGLGDLDVVIDCANGASSQVAAAVLRPLVRRLDVLNAEPDGTNINLDCGSNHPEQLRHEVVATGADIGLAFDGDADRVVAVDAAGSVVDGDQIIALCAVDLHERGMLAKDSVAVTVMTNLGFRLAMQERGIMVVETAVGDRYVLEALDDQGLSLGGEQSGHVIFRDVASTGDGLLTGLMVLDVMARTGRPLQDLAGIMTRLPQVLLNVKVAHRNPAIVDVVADDVKRAEAELGERGRVLIRPSGTEPVVRVMVEAPTHDLAHTLATRLATAVEQAGS